MTRATGQPPPPRFYAPPPTPPEPPEPEERGRARRGQTWQLVALLGAIVLVLGAVFVVVTRKGPSDKSREAAGNPNVVHTVAGELKGRQEATLEVEGGAESVIVHNADLSGLLFSASTLPGSSVEPVATDEGGVVKIGLKGTSVAGQATVHVYLNQAVRWQLRLAGGGLQQQVDFAAGKLAGLEIMSSAGTIELTLPKPDGTIPVKLAGGAGQLSIHVPNGPPVQLKLGPNSTAGTVTVDGKPRTGVQAGTVITPDGWANAKDRFDIEVGGGIAVITVDRR
jgi:hypothetical protein